MSFVSIVGTAAAADRARTRLRNSRLETLLDSISVSQFSVWLFFVHNDSNPNRAFAPGRRKRPTRPFPDCRRTEHRPTTKPAPHGIARHRPACRSDRRTVEHLPCGMRRFPSHSGPAARVVFPGFSRAGTTRFSARTDATASPLTVTERFKKITSVPFPVFRLDRTLRNFRREAPPVPPLRSRDRPRTSVLTFRKIGRPEHRPYSPRTVRPASGLFKNNHFIGNGKHSSDTKFGCAERKTEEPGTTTYATTPYRSDKFRQPIARATACFLAPEGKRIPSRLPDDRPSPRTGRTKTKAGRTRDEKKSRSRSRNSENLRSARKPQPEATGHRKIEPLPNYIDPNRVHIEERPTLPTKTDKTRPEASFVRFDVGMRPREEAVRRIISVSLRPARSLRRCRRHGCRCSSRC